MEQHANLQPGQTTSGKILTQESSGESLYKKEPVTYDTGGQQDDYAPRQSFSFSSGILRRRNGPDNHQLESSDEPWLTVNSENVSQIGNRRPPPQEILAEEVCSTIIHPLFIEENDAYVPPNFDIAEYFLEPEEAKIHNCPSAEKVEYHVEHYQSLADLELKVQTVSIERETSNVPLDFESAEYFLEPEEAKIHNCPSAEKVEHHVEHYHGKETSYNSTEEDQLHASHFQSQTGDDVPTDVNHLQVHAPGDQPPQDGSEVHSGESENGLIVLTIILVLVILLALFLYTSTAFVGCPGKHVQPWHIPDINPGDGPEDYGRVENGTRKGKEPLPIEEDQLHVSHFQTNHVPTDLDHIKVHAANLFREEDQPRQDESFPSSEVHSDKRELVFTKEIDKHVQPQDIKPGDLVAIPRWCGLYFHYAIYIGDGYVVHRTGGILDWLFFIKGKIKKEKLADVIKPSDLDYVQVENGTWRGEKPLPIEEIIHIAESRIGEKGFNLLYNNCEHFTRCARYGKAMSQQADNLLFILQCIFNEYMLFVLLVVIGLVLLPLLLKQN